MGWEQGPACDCQASPVTRSWLIRPQLALLEDWERTIPTPLARPQRFAQIPLNELNNVSRYGCPMGPLNTELGKSQPQLKAISREQFELFRGWL